MIKINSKIIEVCQKVTFSDQELKKSKSHRTRLRLVVRSIFLGLSTQAIYSIKQKISKLFNRTINRSYKLLKLKILPP